MAQETPESSGTTETNTVTPVGPGTAEMTDSARDELALQLVDRLSLWSGAAVSMWLRWAASSFTCYAVCLKFTEFHSQTIAVDRFLPA